MKRSIPHPVNSGYRFQSLEDLRRAVSDMEIAARDCGVHPEEVLFSEEFMISLRSAKLSDRSLVLNLTVAIAPQEAS